MLKIFGKRFIRHVVVAKAKWVNSKNGLLKRKKKGKGLLAWNGLSVRGFIILFHVGPYIG